MLNSLDEKNIHYYILQIQQLRDIIQKGFGDDPDLAYILIALCCLKEIADNTEQLNDFHVSVYNVD